MWPNVGRVLLKRLILNKRRQCMKKHFIFAMCLGVATGSLVAHVLVDDDGNSAEIYPHIQKIMKEKTMEFHQMKDKEVTNKTYNKLRILCCITTRSSDHKKARHVENTWGKRCNIILFMNSKRDYFVSAVNGRNNLWGKTKEALKYVYNHYMDQADWILKADDNIYVILENLRYMLSSHQPTEPVYFGLKLEQFVQQGYMSGLAYVLSREALKRFVEVGLGESSVCSEKNTYAEDVEMGRCMKALNIEAGDTTDSLGRERFFPYMPEYHLIPRYMDEVFWSWLRSYYESQQGMKSWSDSAVSIHYVSPNQMYVLEYLIYRLRPYGMSFQVDMPQELQDVVLGKLNKNSTGLKVLNPFKLG